MAERRIKTVDEFAIALRGIPFVAARLPERLPLAGTGAAYGLWHKLRRLVDDAIAEVDWRAVRELLELYDAVARAGRKGEMFEASHVAFLEDVRLPDDRRALREFWRHTPPLFTADLKADRGLR